MYTDEFNAVFICGKYCIFIYDHKVLLIPILGRSTIILQDTGSKGALSMKVSSNRAFARVGHRATYTAPVFTKKQLAVLTSLAVAFPVLLLAIRTAG